MVSIAQGTFRTVLLTPEGRLLDCRASSVLLPSHDGMIGILRNHAPMLCELQKGIIQVKNIPDRKNAYYLIDGGFARISLNHLTILAYEVITFEGMDREQAERTAALAKESVATKGSFVSNFDEEIDPDRAAFIVKLAHLSEIGND
ncbi:MAG: ATP synthase F1 subunit epsilon [Sedimentisphaerales bacterium]|nr:ATP synthase F1 subunit epsilon [Sedimentisphaerales bacterium]